MVKADDEARISVNPSRLSHSQDLSFILEEDRTALFDPVLFS